MNRYVECGKDVRTIFDHVVNERCPVHNGTKFMLVFDTKKRVRKGKVTLATIESTNDKTRFLTMSDEAPEGTDYIIIIDQVAWENAQDDDRIRLLSHELRHAYIDEKGNFKIIDHDITDFIAEVKLNENKPEWARNLVELTSAIYDQKEDEKDTGGGGGNGGGWKAHS